MNIPWMKTLDTAVNALTSIFSYFPRTNVSQSDNSFCQRYGLIYDLHLTDG